MKDPLSIGTLRDWFAGQALTGLDLEDYGSPQGVAKKAFQLADSMMKEREKAHKE